MSSMRGGDFMNKLNAAVLTVLLGIGFFGGVASATPTVKDQVTSMATDGFGQAVPIVIAIGGAAIALAVAVMGTRWVVRAVRGGGKV